MNNTDGSLNEKLRDAAQLLDAGQTKEARQLLREALAMDRKHLATWELLWKAAYNVEEEIKCLKHILAIDPKNKAARQRFAALQPSTVGTNGFDNQPLQSSTGRPASRDARRASSKRNKQQSSFLLLLLGSLVSMVCVCATGFALYRGGYIPLGGPAGLTATALAANNESCQALITKAIQASGSFCSDTGSNNICYGNTTIQAELEPNATKRFSERGDKIFVNELKRLTAKPLDIETDEWGIAILKVITNLPRSLPGETVTMVVFGNATLDNTSSDSGNLESFYFSSELGQIACEKVPFDGLMITSPDGGGVRFTINETELTLMGTASIKAIKNDQMEISVYKGSARVVSNGEEQYFGAGQKVSIDLGGENGSQATSGPSDPKPLTDEEMSIACTMTGQYCTSGEIIPVSEEQAKAQIESEITPTPTLISTFTLSPIPSITTEPTNTLVVLPTSTKSPGPPTRTKVPTRTNTPGPSPTFTRSRTPTITNTPTRTNTPTITPTFTRTNTPTITLTFTPSLTLTPSNTPPPPPGSICSDMTLTNITLNSNQLSMDITNNAAIDRAIDSFFAYWVKSLSSQKLDSLLLNGDLIWNISDNTPPSDIPLEGNWRGAGDRTIPAGATETFLMQFQDPIVSPTEFHIFFNSGCKLTATQ